MQAGLVEAKYLNDKLLKGNLVGNDLADVQFGLKTTMDYIDYWKKKAVE